MTLTGVGLSIFNLLAVVMIAILLYSLWGLGRGLPSFEEESGQMFYATDGRQERISVADEK